MFKCRQQGGINNSNNCCSLSPFSSSQSSDFFHSFPSGANKCSPHPHSNISSNGQETIRSARGRAPLILISKIHNSSKSMVPLPSSDFLQPMKTMHRNVQDQLIPSYFVCWVQKPCWIKGRSEFRSTINVFSKKPLWDAARSCVSITNQPRLRLLNSKIPKKTAVTSNSIPTQKSSDTRWCISTCMVLRVDWSYPGTSTCFRDEMFRTCWNLWSSYLSNRIDEGCPGPNVGGSQKNRKFPVPLPKKRLNIDTKSEALQIFMEIFLFWESWKKLHRHRFGRVTWHLSMGKVLLFFEAVNWQWSIQNIQKPTLFTQFSQRVAI